MPGHIRSRGKRADGTTKWAARWRHPNSPGGKQAERQFRDKDVARRWLMRMDAEAHGAMFAQPTNAQRSRPFKEVVGMWEETCWTGLAPSTTARYGQIVRTYLLPEFEHHTITEMTRGVVRRYFARLTREGKTPGTVRKVHTVLSAIMSEAVELELLPVNPCTRMRGLPAMRTEERVVLTAEQVRTLAERIPQHFRLLVYMAAYTGLRAGELAGLRRKDVDLLRGVVQVRQALEPLDPPVFGGTKTGKTRTVTLPKFLRAMLTDHLAGRIPGEALTLTRSCSRRRKAASCDTGCSCAASGTRRSRATTSAKSKRRYRPSFTGCAFTIYGTRAPHC